MAIQTKEVLKSYFNTGDKPTEAQFADLIDSCYNDNLIVDYDVNIQMTGTASEATTNLVSLAAHFDAATYAILTVLAGGSSTMSFVKYYAYIAIPKFTQSVSSTNVINEICTSQILAVVRGYESDKVTLNKVITLQCSITNSFQLSTTRKIMVRLYRTAYIGSISNSTADFAESAITKISLYA